MHAMALPKLRYYNHLSLETDWRGRRIAIFRNYDGDWLVYHRPLVPEDGATDESPAPKGRFATLEEARNAALTGNYDRPRTTGNVVALRARGTRRRRQPPRRPLSARP